MVTQGSWPHITLTEARDSWSHITPTEAIKGLMVTHHTIEARDSWSHITLTLALDPKQDTTVEENTTLVGAGSG